ncbi:MAG: asparagine synthase (glutamine-hydrolyzing) [Planctomycetaceae bacterium]|jgi:asparagine synthase (glutamine-hydrolysing)|nr:asparagine synthase (glutamine-hydrolyzing) [Planctomycetaceae bacterium]
MCGICGAVWSEPSKALDGATLDTMTDLLRHRGPDDRGTFLQHGVALGHRRLAIIDLTPSGHQPMPNEDETVWIVFNGEIYNFEPLRRELLGRGHRFRGDSDTEVLIHLYEEEQENLLQRLNGMFALAVWDVRERKLFLARDRIGKKPLFYRNEPNRLMFASEMKSILSVNGVPRDIDPSALDDYLTYQYVPHPKTIFRGISKLSPGHFALWQDGHLTVRRYWNYDWNNEDDRLTFEEWSEELRALAADAVRIRLRSDVPIGAFLSGGIDSSITAGIMQQESSQQIRTFSIGFPQKEYDETFFARQAAESFGTKHQELVVTSDIDDILPKLIWHYDEPFADSSAIPTWFLCEMTRREVTVALSGDGGDELFAGYDRYRAVRLGMAAEKIPFMLRKILAGPIRSLIPASTRQRSTLRRLKRFLEALGMEPLEQYLQWIAIFNRERRQKLYTPEFSEQISGQDSLDFLREAEQHCLRRDRVTRIALTDMLTYLPCDIMTKVDTASMSHALECRAPLLDYRIAEWAARLPIRHKIEGNRGKKILRETFRDFLPPGLEQRRKMGFGVPIDHWFRGSLRETVRDVLLDSQTIQRGFFERKFVEQLLNEHFANRFDHAYRIWALFVFEHWMRCWGSG